MSKPPDVARHVGIDEVFGDLVELVVGRDLLHARSAVLRAVVAEGAQLEQSPQQAAQRHGEQRAQAAGQEAAGASTRRRMARRRPDGRTAGWSAAHKRT